VERQAPLGRPASLARPRPAVRPISIVASNDARPPSTFPSSHGIDGGVGGPAHLGAGSTELHRLVKPATLRSAPRVSRRAGRFVGAASALLILRVNITLHHLGVRRASTGRFRCCVRRVLRPASCVRLPAVAGSWCCGLRTAHGLRLDLGAVIARRRARPSSSRSVVQRRRRGVPPFASCTTACRRHARYASTTGRPPARRAGQRGVGRFLQCHEGRVWPVANDVVMTTTLVS